MVARLVLVVAFGAAVGAVSWAYEPGAAIGRRAAAPPAAAPTTTTTAPPTTTTAPPAPEVVYVVGDSVLLGAREELPAALPGRTVVVDAVGSRRLPDAIGLLRTRRAEVGDGVVVIDLGNNHVPEEGAFADHIDAAMQALDGVRRVVWVTLAERWPSRVELNAAIRDAPDRWPNAVVADWAPIAAADPALLDDGLHLTPAGAEALARLIAETVGPPA